MTTATMPFFTVDTLQFSNRLQKAGLDRKIADEFAEAIKETQSLSTEGLATKHDVLLVQNDVVLVKKDLEGLRKDFENLKQLFDQKFESFEHKLTVKMFVMLITAVSLVTWLDKVIS